MKKIYRTTKNSRKLTKEQSLIISYIKYICCVSIKGRNVHYNLMNKLNSLKSKRKRKLFNTALSCVFDPKFRKSFAMDIQPALNYIYNYNLVTHNKVSLLNSIFSDSIIISDENEILF